jgi:hypothetical protein
MSASWYSRALHHFLFLSFFSFPLSFYFLAFLLSLFFFYLCLFFLSFFSFFFFLVDIKFQLRKGNIDCFLLCSQWCHNAIFKHNAQRVLPLTHRLMAMNKPWGHLLYRCVSVGIAAPTRSAEVHSVPKYPVRGTAVQLAGQLEPRAWLDWTSSPLSYCRRLPNTRVRCIGSQFGNDSDRLSFGGFFRPCKMRQA